MKVLVCGGRDYGTMNIHEKTIPNEIEVAYLYGALSALHSINPITTLVHGAAKGADLLADELGYHHRVNVHSYPANWGQHGRAAGPIRNQEMLDKENPSFVVAFKGGKGTEDMVNRAIKKGIKVVDLRETN